MTEVEPSGTRGDDLLLYTGRFYVAAGLAHALDFATDNRLLSSAGLGSFSELPPIGQALGVVWVLIGLAQPLGTTRAQRQAGVLAYGGWELFLALAGFLVTTDTSGELAWLKTAAIGQAVLGAAYLLLRTLSVSETHSPASDDMVERTSSRSTTPRMLAGRPPEGSRQRGGGSRVERPSGLQQQLEDALGKNAFRAIVILTGVMCYPLMAYGIAMKAAARAAGHDM